jgi:hypothetical protein
MGGNIIIFATFRYPGGRNILEFTGGRRPAVKKKKREKKKEKKAELENLHLCSAEARLDGILTPGD